MSVDDQQRYMTTVCLISPGMYFLLRIINMTTRVKFPGTGPNEVLFTDVVIAAVICFVCSRFNFIRYSGKMIILTMLRTIFFVFLLCSIYAAPEWYTAHNDSFDHALCWIFLAIHIIASAIYLTMSYTIFYQEELFRLYDWATIKSYFSTSRVNRNPPDYHAAITVAAFPPSYDEAINAHPPGYASTGNTPPIVSLPASPAISPTQTPVHVSRSSLDRYQANSEEVETIL